MEEPYLTITFKKNLPYT